LKSLIEGSFRNKAAMILIVIMVLAMGGLSYTKLPMEFLPEADNPQVTVSVIGPGYDASAMDRAVTGPIEKALSGIKGKTNVFSSSGDGFSQVNLNFDSSTNMKEAKVEVEKAVSAVDLPNNVSSPYVVQLNTSMIPISFVTLAFSEGVGDAEKEELEQRIWEEFNAIDGVGSVQLAGKSQPTVLVAPDPAKLAEKGIPLQALYGVLQGRSASSAVGESVLDGQIVNLNVVANLQDVETLKRLPVVPGVLLGEVANVAFDDSKESLFRVDGKDALEFVISKGANSNAVSVGEEVEKIIDKYNEEEASVELKLAISTSEQVVHSVNSMMKEVLLGALFATVVILVFMRNVRATLVTIVSIPLSLAMTLYLLDLSGITLNILTLGGVAVAVGRLVDDSIVVIENIFRRLQREKFSKELVIAATAEVARAITASTLTTIAVFLPMSLLRGSLQSFLLPFALTMTYSLLSSLIVALTVIPLMSAGVLRNSGIKEHQPSKRFVRLLEWNLKRKWLPIAGAVVLLAASVATYATMPQGAIDSSNAENVNVGLQYKPGTPAEQLLESGFKLETYLMNRDDVELVAMSNGNSADAAKYGSVTSSTLVSYMLKMKPGADAEKAMEEVKAEAANYPEAELNVSAGSFMSGGSSTQVIIDITGNNLGDIGKAAEDVMAKIEPIEDVLKVESNQQEKKSIYTLEVDPTAAKAGDIATQLQGMLNPVPVGSIAVDGQTIPVLIEPVLKPNTESMLSELTVLTDEGPRAVSSVAKWVKSEEATTFFHKDGKSYVRISASVEPSRLSKVGAEINERLKDVAPPEGVKLNVGGASADQSADIESLFMMMIVSIGVVYLIMVFTFKTLKAPLAIISSIFFVPIGAVLGLILTGITPDFTAIFGVVMLIGIVVTNAIVLIDRVKHNEETMTIREALLEAAGTRMRPILMTAIATVGAMLPLVFGSSESGSIVSQSLAVVVIGGLVVSTLLTLVIVPCVYELLYFRKSARQRKIAAASVQEAAAQ